MTQHDNQRGGKRPGAGRPKGSRNKVSSPVLVAIREVAQGHGRRALARIAALMDSDDDRVALAAANAMLDRAYGRPPQTVDLEGSATLHIITDEPMSEDEWDERHAGQ